MYHTYIYIYMVAIVWIQYLYIHIIIYIYIDIHHICTVPVMIFPPWPKAYRLATARLQNLGSPSSADSAAPTEIVSPVPWDGGGSNKKGSKRVEFTGKIMGKSWENMGKSWEDLGKIWENRQNWWRKFGFQRKAAALKNSWVMHRE